MAKIITHRLKSLTDYMEVIQGLQRSVKHALWFRGITDSQYGLVPSMYRHPKLGDPGDLQKLEHQLMTRFRQRSIPYRTRDLADDWEAMFFMQHYGVPTRLLDWTENPLIALHFALMHASARAVGSKIPLTESVIWVIDPVAWNTAALSDLSYKGGALTTTDDGLKGFAPGATSLRTHPVALYGAHNSPRIVAQQGVFTIFGSAQTPMEKLIQDGVFPPKALSKIVVAPSRIRRIRQALLNQGITETVVFPDLEGLARETKRYFGFEG